MNKKNLFLVALVVVIAGGVYYFYQSNKQTTPSAILQENIVAPSRPAEINGFILSALGNEIKIAKEVGKPILTEEEQAAKKAAMQKMSPEERAAAKAEESANLKTEEISLFVPVGVVISKGAGDASGNTVNAEIAELQKGIYVSIWTNENNEIEYIKIKGS